MSTVSWSLLRKIIVRYVVNRAAGSYCLRSILLDCETWFVRVFAASTRSRWSIIARRLCSLLRPRPHSPPWATPTHSSAPTPLLLTASTRSHCLTSYLLCTRTHTRPFNGPLSWTTRVSRYQKGKTNLDITEARDSEWQWHQLGHMQVCTSLQTDKHASTPTT